MNTALGNKRIPFHSLEDLRKFDLIELEQKELASAKAVLIRHGYSEGNAGKKSKSPEAIGLTERGKEQSDWLASFVNHDVAKIIHSTYLRTKLTAQPAIRKFHKAEVLEEPIHEYTYLHPGKYSGTTYQERKAGRDEYWKKMDPEFRDGQGAESFVDFWNRVENLRNLIDKAVPGTLIFTHGMVMRLLLLQIDLGLSKPNKEAMATFYDREAIVPIPNTARIAMRSGSAHSGVKVSHLPKSLITG